MAPDPTVLYPPVYLAGFGLAGSVKKENTPRSTRDSFLTLDSQGCPRHARRETLRSATPPELGNTCEKAPTAGRHTAAKAPLSATWGPGLGLAPVLCAQQARQRRQHQ